MSTLTIHGTPASRTMRVLWACKELGIDYTLDPVNHRKGENKLAAYTALNPNQTIPTISDGDFVLWESFAITLYLARKYGGPIAVSGLENEALAEQWSMWALTRLEDPCTVIQQSTNVPGSHSEERVAWAYEAVKAPLAVFEGQVAKQDYVMGDAFNIADLNLAGAMWPLYRTQYDFTGLPRTADWVGRCFDRPAIKEVMEIMRQSLAEE